MWLCQVFSYSFDGFTVPVLRATLPGETATGRDGLLPLRNGLFPLPLTFYVGILLFGIFAYRSQREARRPALAFMLSMLFVFGGGAIAHSPLHYERAIPIGFSINSLAFVWLGIFLIVQANQILAVPAQPDVRAEAGARHVPAANPAGWGGTTCPLKLHRGSD